MITTSNTVSAIVKTCQYTHCTPAGILLLFKLFTRLDINKACLNHAIDQMERIYQLLARLNNKLSIIVDCVWMM